MNQSIRIALALLLGLAVAPSDVFARGFGGFGGGGFHAGGFGGGGFGGYHGGGFAGGGGSHAGGFDAGGFHAGGFDAGGFHAGGFDASGFHGGDFEGVQRAGGFGGSLDRGELNSFLGLPTDGGMHAAGGAFSEGGFASGADGAAAWRGGAAGHVYQGQDGTTIAHGTAGIQGASIGPGGVAAGGKVASGTVVKGPEGNVYARGAEAGRGIAAGPNGVVAGTGAVAGRGFYSPTAWHAQAMAGRRWFAGGGYFTPGWVTAHPWAWTPAGYTAAAWATAAWTAATWPAMGTWFNWSNAPVYNYDYGTDIVYQGGNVYYGGQSAGTAAQYYQEAASLAGSDADATAGQDGQWLPLGVFGLLASGQKVPEMIFQLAVNKDGLLRGNYYDQVAQNNLPVHGAVDKRNQRVAWRVGNNKDFVVETGLANLTRDESTALVHFGPDRAQQFQLIRTKQPSPPQE